MSSCCPERLSITPDDHLDPAATVEIDADTVGPMAVHRALFHPGQSELPDLIVDAARSITPVEGGVSDLARALDNAGVSALGAADDRPGHYALLVANALLQDERRQAAEEGDVIDRWIRLQYLSRHIDNQPHGSMDDVEDGPVALLAQLDTVPTVVIRLSSSLMRHTESTQRKRLLGYLRRLTPGVNVRITGTLRTLRKLVDSHAGDLPADVHEHAHSTIYGGGGASGSGSGEGQRSPREVALDALDELGLTDRQAGRWRVLHRVCTHVDGQVPQATLQHDTLLGDVGASTVRRRAQRLADLGLIDRPLVDGQRYLEPTAAGQEALSRAQSEAPSLLGCWSTGDAPEHEPSAETADNAAVSDPPNSTAEPCKPNAHEGCQGEDRPTAEARAAVQGGSSSRTPTTRWLGRDEHHAAASAVPEDGGIALEERSLAGTPDDRDVAWSLNEDRNEVVVEVTSGTAMAHTAVRLCDALLSEKAQSQVLNPANLNGGPGKTGLEGLVIDNPYVLRKGRTLGWLRDQDCDGRRLLDRLRQARNRLTKQLAAAAEDAENGVYDADTLADILQQAHGLQGVLVALYDLLGYDVVRKVNIPEPWDVDADAVATFVRHQTAISSRYGAYTANRYLFEPRDDHREDTLATPSPGPGEYRGTVSGSWVLAAPSTDELEAALKDDDNQPHDLQEGDEAFFEFVLEPEIVDASRREAVAEVVARLAPSKNLRPDRQITTLLHALTGSVSAAAAAVNGIGAADDRRHMDHGDLEYGLWTLNATDASGDPYHDDVDATDILPDIGPRSVSKLVWALLRTDDSLSQRQLSEAAGVSTQSIRNNREHLDTLEALGLLSIDKGGEGKADVFSLSLLGVDDDEFDEFAASRFDSLSDGLTGEDTWRLNEASFEMLMLLADRYDHTIPLDYGDDAAMAAWSGPVHQRTHQPMLRNYPELRPLLTLLGELLESPVADSTTTIRLGKEPQAVAQQQTLSSTVAAGD